MPNSNIIRGYHKYKKYYDWKTQASPLKVIDFNFLPNPRIATQSDKSYI